MRKLIIIAVAILATLSIAGCKCSKEEAVVDQQEIIVENTISTDREYMSLNYGNYSWYETCVVYDNYFDADTTISVYGVSNVFQVVIAQEESYDTKVVSIAHMADVSGIDAREHAFWVGDFKLNEENINLTFDQAFARLMETNIPKPHSKNVVLRREIGPKPNVNAQYIFGNPNYQVYVDAVTGNVTDTNPVY